MSNKPAFGTWLEKEVSRVTGKTYGNSGEGALTFHVNMSLFGRMPSPTSSARITGPCGETMEVYLKIHKDRIEQASFFTDGCGASIVCGATASEKAAGRSIDEAALIDGDAILEFVGGLPEDHRHCAFLAAETLQAAIHNHLARPEFREHEA
ncbi:MAG: iron-sulfur cluster assembly scaffold protein [Syntrophobacteraceae bacterium]|jgi:nitrogen fixation NifU-like protein|nr:iron-sulfur cluster assembly scaffold protein [Syntrophobacteraceae bacterium]